MTLPAPPDLSCSGNRVRDQIVRQSLELERNGIARVVPDRELAAEGLFRGAGTKCRQVPEPVPAFGKALAKRKLGIEIDGRMTDSQPRVVCVEAVTGKTTRFFVAARNSKCGRNDGAEIWCHIE